MRSGASLKLSAALLALACTGCVLHVQRDLEPAPGFRYAPPQRRRRRSTRSSARRSSSRSRSRKTRTHEIAAAVVPLERPQRPSRQSRRGPVLSLEGAGPQEPRRRDADLGHQQLSARKDLDGLRAPRRTRHARHLDLRHRAGVPVDGAELRADRRRLSGAGARQRGTLSLGRRRHAAARRLGRRPSPRSTRRASPSSASA